MIKSRPTEGFLRVILHEPLSLLPKDYLIPKERGLLTKVSGALTIPRIHIAITLLVFQGFSWKVLPSCSAVSKNRSLGSFVSQSRLCTTTHN
jgi:hypothetical protein